MSLSGAGSWRADTLGGGIISNDRTLLESLLQYLLLCTSFSIAQARNEMRHVARATNSLTCSAPSVTQITADKPPLQTSIYSRLAEIHQDIIYAYVALLISHLIIHESITFDGPTNTRNHGGRLEGPVQGAS